MDEREKLEQAIAAQEGLRGALPDEVIEATIAVLREKLAALETAEHRQQRKQATILFVDIAGHTALTVNLDPEEQMAVIDPSIARLAAKVDEHGGRVARYQGDGFKAVFGLPVATESDPQQAVRAGLAIQAEAAMIARELKETRGLSGFQVRVGITTGLIFAGGETEGEDTIKGPPVNLAARLESTAEPGTILISHDTFIHVRGLFEVVPLDAIQAKGFTEPIPVFRVLRARPHSFYQTARGVEGVETRMIGREAEMRALQDTFHNVIKGAEKRLLTIVGEAGVGKSRLLLEFNGWLERQAEPVLLLKAQGMPEKKRVTNSLFRDVFARYFEIAEADNKVEALQKFRAGAADILDAAQADVMGHWLGFDFSASEAVNDLLGSGEFSAAAQTYVGDFIRARATTVPVVIFLEDLHWADDRSLDLIMHLARPTSDSNAGGESLLIIGMTRPVFFERRPGWGNGLAFCERIRLAPLSRKMSSILVDEVLQHVADIPDSLRQFVIESAEGNPFYLEELVKTLIDKGVIVRGDPQWRVLPGRLVETTVPTTLTGLLQARLDALPGPERETLQRAAVIGRLFWDTAVADLAEVAVQDLQRLLSEVRRRELIFQHERSSFANADEYLFKHALLRDVAYETVLLKERRIYHHRAAQWLAANTGERQKEYLEQIAAHYMRADEREKALPYLLQAGDEARFRNDFGEAARYYEEALAIDKSVGDTEAAVRVLMKLGLTHHCAFDFERARQAYDEGFLLHQHMTKLDASLPSAPHPLRIVGLLSPSALDPIKEDSELLTVLFSGLVRLNSEMDLVPDVAASWQIKNDGRTYIFQLRDDVRWSDGRPVSAGDFVFAWRRALDPRHVSSLATFLFDAGGTAASQPGSSWDPGLVAVSAPDALTLRVDLEKPAAFFLQILAVNAAMPVPKHVVEAHGEAWTEEDNFVSNGRFLLESWQPGESMILRRNPTYHGAFEGNVQRIVLQFNRDFEATMPLYVADQLDILNTWTFPPDRLVQAVQRYADDYKNILTNVTGFVGFDVNRPPFDDARIRQAFVLATDRQFLTQHHELGRAFAATGGFVPPGMPGHVPDSALPYDVNAARRLLGESGYPDGRGLPPLEALVAPWDAVRVTEYILKPWESNLGVKIAWEIASWEDDYFARTREEKPQIYAYGWGSSYNDPDSFLRMGILNITDWQDAAYFNLMEQARQIFDHRERIRLYRQAEEILRDEAPIMPVLYLRSNFLLKPWLRNYALRNDVSLTNWFDVMIIDPH